MPSKIRIYSDGGARGNPGPAAVGVLICDEKDEIIDERGETIGENTNNVAEYTAVLVGLELAKKWGAKQISYFVDSELVAHQLSGKYKVKAPHLVTLVNMVKEKLQQFEKVVFTPVPREHLMLQKADKLVNEALDMAGY